MSAPTPAEFESAVRAGRLTTGTPHFKHVLGKMFVVSFLSGVPTPQF